MDKMLISNRQYKWCMLCTYLTIRVSEPACFGAAPAQAPGIFFFRSRLRLWSLVDTDFCTLFEVLNYVRKH